MMEFKPSKSNINFISVGGFGASGGTAVRDLLRELDGFIELGAEFRLIKEHYGLMDLETFLTKTRRDILYSDLAIKDFIWLAKELNRVGGRFTREGMGYSHLIKGFMLKTEKYINKLTKFKFRARWHVLNYKKSYKKQILTRILIKFGLIDGFDEMNYTLIDKEEFGHITKGYIEDLFTDLSENGNLSVLLHNAIPTVNSYQALDYFDNIKQIIVDRDPRDILADIITRKITFFFGIKALQDEDYKLFVEDFKHKRREYYILENDPRILIIKFENLVNDYENTIKKIFKFLQINTSHKYKRHYFNPEASSANIGLWKNVLSNEAIHYINDNLPNYIYHSK